MEKIAVIVVFRHGTKPDVKAFPHGTIFVDDEGKGKKYALGKAIGSVDAEYVWLMDDDVLDAAGVIADNALLEVGKADMCVLPLRMTEGSGRLIERLQQTEYAAIQTLTMLSVERGHPVMCSGANMIVRRSSWLTSEADLHKEIPSGDDMFLLESFKRRGLNITGGDICMTIDPAPSIKQLLGQRMRWAGKAPHYTDKDILRCGASVVTMNVLAVVCPPLWLLKLAAEAALLGYGRRHYPSLMPQKRRPAVVILLSILYPWYMLVSLIGGMLRKGW